MTTNLNDTSLPPLTIPAIASMLKSIAINPTQKVIAARIKADQPIQVLAHLTLSDDQSTWQVAPTEYGLRYWGRNIPQPLTHPTDGPLTDDNPVGLGRELINQLVSTGDNEQLLIGNNRSELIVKSLQPSDMVMPATYAKANAFNGHEKDDSNAHQESVTLIEDGTFVPAMMRQLRDEISTKQRKQVQKAIIIEYFAIKQLQQLSNTKLKHSLHVDENRGVYTMFQAGPSRQFGLYTHLDQMLVPLSDVAAENALISPNTVKQRLQVSPGDSSLAVLFKLCGSSGVRQAVLLTRIMFSTMVRQKPDVHRDFHLSWAVGEKVSAKFAPQTSCWPEYIAQGQPEGNLSCRTTLESFVDSYPGLSDIVGSNDQLLQSSWNKACAMYQAMVNQLKHSVGEMGIDNDIAQELLIEFSNQEVPESLSLSKLNELKP